jgi:hypothetical protein
MKFTLGTIRRRSMSALTMNEAGELRADAPVHPYRISPFGVMSSGCSEYYGMFRLAPTNKAKCATPTIW